MEKVANTDNWGAFKAITKMDKLIPRYAAYLYRIYSHKIFYNLPFIIQFVTNNLPGQRRNTLLNKVYLKDIIATINNYN